MSEREQELPQPNVSLTRPSPAAKEEAGVREPNAEEIAQGLYRELGLNDEEYKRVIRILGRKPNYTEAGIFGVLWSEHCCYKHSKPVLRRFPTTGKHVLMGPGEGAGVVDIGDGLAAVFKMESHNHPSAIEPYQGAATGVGGILRDIFSMGARPVALMDSLRFGSLDNPRVQYLFEHVVSGISGYGNCVGVPTVGGETYYSPAYEGNPLVNVMCVGVVEHDNIQVGKARGVGNWVVYMGASTGRDGIHGATFASEELSEESEAKRPAVQVGDPFMEKVVMEACLELVEKGLLVAVQDMGAAGLTSSSAEMAAKGETGMELDLTLVPQREAAMTPFEMMLSESQERMLLVIEPTRWPEVKAVCDKWGVNAVVVGKVTDDHMLRLLHRGQVVAEVPVVDLVDEAPVYNSVSQEPAYYREWQSLSHEEVALRLPEPQDYPAALKEMLQRPNLADKSWIYRQYDYRVGTRTLVAPGTDAAVVHVEGTNKALAMTTDGNANFVSLDPCVGGALVVAEAARNIVCSGGVPLVLTDNLNYGNPEKPAVFWQLERSVEGMREACLALETPVIGGNVSLYNETPAGAILPTPVVGMVGLIEHAALITPMGLQEGGSSILLLGRTKAEMGGSQYQEWLLGRIEGKPPELDLSQERELQRLVQQLIRSQWVQSAHDVSDGGLAVALLEMAMAGERGFTLEAETPLRPDFYLFSESASRVLLEVAPRHIEQVKEMAAMQKVPCEVVGRVHGGEETDRVRMRINGVERIDEPLSELKRLWKEALPCQIQKS